jgi:hypothetical protein
MDIADIQLHLEAEQRNHCLDYCLDYDPIPNGIAFEMVKAFYRESGYRNWQIRKVEEKFEVATGYGKRLTGKIDAIMEHESKDFLIEHKSTSVWNGDGAEYLHNLLWDEQSTNYLYAYRELYGKPAAGIMYCIVENRRSNRYWLLLLRSGNTSRMAHFTPISVKRTKPRKNI